MEQSLNVPVGVLYVLLGCIALIALRIIVNSLVEAIRQAANELTLCRNQVIALSELISAHTKAMDLNLATLLGSIQPASDEIKLHLAGVPKLLEGVTRLGGILVQLIQQVRRADQDRQKNPFGRNPAPTPMRDEGLAEIEHEVTAIMRSEGISRDEALLRMNQANGETVWNNEIMRGW